MCLCEIKQCLIALTSTLKLLLYNMNSLRQASPQHVLNKQHNLHSVYCFILSVINLKSNKAGSFLMVKNSRPLEQLLWEGWRPLRKMRQAGVKNDMDVFDPALTSDRGHDLLLTSAYDHRISLCFLIRGTRCESVATTAQTER